ncbi:epoxide hydrolase family protein [Baekduia soli]|uniref:epoxide hydrolase family protein n=1 Tax=Baekduia soli TaxID=496014 RepID=UPI0016525B26|nr:epoxide hydrolase family protein [Baekduia soli]
MEIDAVPFEVNVPQAVLDDLARRLEATRWPVEPASGPWRYGADSSYVRRVVDHWRDGYDWRASERAINRFDNYTTTIEGLEVHFILEHGSGPAPRPLIVTHGWPGSIVEFLEVVEPLAHPERFGGDVADAFTVVVPSIPGYGFSQAPDAPITPRDVGRMFDTLMTERLGFATYLAQGGDWGSIITSWMGYDQPEHVEAMHLNLVAFEALPPDGRLSEEEQAWVERSAVRRDPEAGYRIQQGTRPHTLAYGLTDSPAGLAAWILEKFHGWTVPGEDRDPPFDLDHLLANVMLYWLAGPGPASWLYIATIEQGARRLPDGERVRVPTSFLLCPRDISVPPPDSVIERAYVMVRRTDAPDGGHFVAFEQGDLFVRDVREAFRDRG